jgi:hypothetical protein
VEALAHPYLADYANADDEPVGVPPSPDAFAVSNIFSFAVICTQEMEVVVQFEALEDLTKEQLQAEMLSVLETFRPSMQAGGILPRRPKSTRMVT